MAEESNRRIELVAEPTDSTREAARTGAGLILGFVLGRNSLIGAATGSEQFELAIAHFVGVVLASVAGALFVGAMYDRMNRAAARSVEDAATEMADDADAANTPALTTNPPTELPLGMPR